MTKHLPRCEVIPLPDHQVSFQIDGSERTRWHFDPKYPRPFLFPIRGPSGAELTRMGHPGAPNHDHHRSVWFAHHKVTGVDFWSDVTNATIRQSQWVAYQDEDTEAMMAVRLAWNDGHDPGELLEQQVIISVSPAPQRPEETLIEIDTTFAPTSEMLEFGQTNFGFFAVRVARSISAFFGGGELTGDSGSQSEKRLFAKPSRWMDYSGPVRGPGGEVVEGITYIDHPQNPGQPTHWHVREDGWMGASVCMHAPQLTTKQSPLRLRYLLHAHAGLADQKRSEELWEFFRSRPAIEVLSGRKLRKKHTSQVLRRANASSQPATSPEGER